MSVCACICTYHVCVFVCMHVCVFLCVPVCQVMRSWSFHTVLQERGTSRGAADPQDQDHTDQPQRQELGERSEVKPAACLCISLVPRLFLCARTQTNQKVHKNEVKSVRC